MFDPHLGRSQVDYVFTYCGATISWKSPKHTMVETSSNHTELLSIHEASRECNGCDLSLNIFEDHVDYLIS